MKCDERLTRLNEHADGRVDPAVGTEFEKPVAGGNSCQVVADNIRQTLAFRNDGQPQAMPV